MGLNLKAKNRKVKKIWYDGNECIWVDGFKATKSDLTCRDFQYELNKEYIHEGEVSVCHNGFHFCPKLKNVFGFYDLEDKNRFFKVRALVYKKDFGNGYDEKYAAKKIILTEELGFSELQKYICEKYKLIKTEDDWNIIQSEGYEEFRKNIFINEMKQSGFGEAFISVVFDECCEDDEAEIIKLAKVLKEEKISKDMAAYLILQKCE